MKTLERELLEQELSEKYEILDEIGRGGFGVVFRALDRNLAREVAIKILHLSLCAEESIVARFVREARFAASLDHPGIVRIYQFESSTRLNYLIMEYINGITLKEWILDRDSIDLARSLDLSIQIASAIAYAHQKGVIHRDIKPQNIILKDNLTPVITDFGIAKTVASSNTQSSIHTLGSPQYISPEQLTGQEIDARADQYSLGIVMYELFCGQLPFKGTEFSLYNQQLNEDPTPLEQINPKVPERLAGLVHRLMQKDRDERFDSTDDLIVELESIDAAKLMTDSIDSSNDPDEMATKESTGDSTKIIRRPGEKQDETIRIKPEASFDHQSVYISDSMERKHPTVHVDTTSPPQKRAIFLKSGTIALLVAAIISIASAMFIFHRFSTNNPETASSDNAKAPVSTDPAVPASRETAQPSGKAVYDFSIPAFQYIPSPRIADLSSSVWDIEETPSPEAMPAERETPARAATPTVTKTLSEMETPKTKARSKLGDIPLVLIKNGEYLMGSSENEPGREDDENQHRVKLLHSFFISETEITQQQWISVMGNNPSKNVGAGCPVENITWYDAIAFCNRYSQINSLEPCYFNDENFDEIFEGVSKGKARKIYWNAAKNGFRLPTEAEWEYACRASTKTAFYRGVMTRPEGFDPVLNKVGWFNENSNLVSHLVKQKAPNKWGLYDMHGNVSEFCWDGYDDYKTPKLAINPPGSSKDSLKTRRGGSFSLLAKYCRSAARGKINPGKAESFCGFRIIRTSSK